jgi:hypothetical protein
MLGLPKLEAANLDGQWIPGHLPDLAVLLRSGPDLLPGIPGVFIQQPKRATRAQFTQSSMNCCERSIARGMNNVVRPKRIGGNSTTPSAGANALVPVKLWLAPLWR